jgi:hypothetical protein
MGAAAPAEVRGRDFAVPLFHRAEREFSVSSMDPVLASILLIQASACSCVLGALNVRHKHGECQITREVLAYFVRNPLAADSLEGVARWRLMDEVIRRRLEETEVALNWLVAKGYLVSSVVPGGTATFRLNGDRLVDAQEFLSRSARSRQQRSAR